MDKRLVLIGLVLAMAVLLIPGKASAGENPDWTKQLVAFTLEKSIGTTYTYDIDEHESGMGAKWNPIRAFGGYVSAGLFTYLNEPSLGGNISLDVAKIVRRGEPAVKTESTINLQSFDIGYWFVWNALDNFFDHPWPGDADKTGALGTVIRFDW